MRRDGVAQLTHRESLRGIEACLLERPALASRMGMRGRVTRTNLAYANEHRDPRVRRARQCADAPGPAAAWGAAPGIGPAADLFALDATVIAVSLALFPWAHWQRDQASVKLNVLLDGRTDRPVFASLDEGNRHEAASLDALPVYPGSYYVTDRGHLDFARLYRLHPAGAFLVTRLKTNPCDDVAESRPADQATGLRCDQTIRLNSATGRERYPAPLRRISYTDPETKQVLVFLTNQFELAALLIALNYRRRRAIELFFRWIKQHLRLRGFFSNSRNGVHIQIWTAPVRPPSGRDRQAAPSPHPVVL